MKYKSLQTLLFESNPLITRRMADDLVKQFSTAISSALAKGHGIMIPSVGSLLVVHRAQRLGRNPRQPEIEIVIPAGRRVRFKPAPALEAVL